MDNYKKLICIKEDKDSYLFKGEIYYTNVPSINHKNSNIYLTFKDKDCKILNGYINCDNFTTLEELREDKLNKILN